MALVLAPMVCLIQFGSDDHEAKSGLSAYLPHLAIVIGSDSDFVAQGWPGNGNPANPYLISGFEIDGLDFQNGISISNTTKYFTIQGCYVYGSWQAGIMLYSAANGLLHDNVVSDNSPWGISATGCSGLVVMNNTCTGNIGIHGVYSAGIYISNCPGANIIDNMCTNNQGDGIVCMSNDCTISGNSCNGNDDFGGSSYVSSGIQVSGTNNVVTENTCGTNTEAGIFMQSSSGAMVANNTCQNDPLVLESSGGCTVTRNMITNGQLELRSSSHNDVNNNTCGILITGSGTLGGSTFNTIADNNCSGSGIRISPSDYDPLTTNVSGANRLLRNDCTDCALAIDVFLADSTVMVQNDCSNSADGIALEKSHSSILTGNVLVDVGAAAIIIKGSTYTTLRGNIMVSCGISIVGGSTLEWALQDIDESNTVNGLPVMYTKGAISGEVTGNYGQVIVGASKNLVVWNLTINDTSSGISVGCSSNVTVAGCDVGDNPLEGVYLYSSENCTVFGNSCHGNRYGISLSSTKNCLVRDNICMSNTHTGIVLFGLLGTSTTGNIVTNNTCSQNDANGIAVVQSQNNNISYNLIERNGGYGVYLAEDIEGRLPLPVFTTGNLIFGNTFVDNWGPGSQACDGGAHNYWYLDGYGNYWSDWQSPDDNGDGIVDVPYAIAGSAGAMDYYPLTVLPPLPVPEVPPPGILISIVVLLLAVFIGVRRHRIR